MTNLDLARQYLKEVEWTDTSQVAIRTFAKWLDDRAAAEPVDAEVSRMVKAHEVAARYDRRFAQQDEPTAEHDCPAAGMDISVRGVCAICDALTAPSDTQDSARYRWLRDYARTQGRDQLCCWVGPPWDSSSVILWEDKLDRTIDERIRRSAVNRGAEHG